MYIICNPGCSKQCKIQKSCCTNILILYPWVEHRPIIISCETPSLQENNKHKIWLISFTKWKKMFWQQFLSKNKRTRILFMTQWHNSINEEWCLNLGNIFSLFLLPCPMLHISVNFSFLFFKFWSHCIYFVWRTLWHWKDQCIREVDRGRKCWMAWQSGMGEDPSQTSQDFRGWMVVEEHDLLHCPAWNMIIFLILDSPKRVTYWSCKLVLLVCFMLFFTS